MRWLVLDCANGDQKEKQEEGEEIQENAPRENDSSQSTGKKEKYCQEGIPQKARDEGEGESKRRKG
jgi:hypothetical protein